MIIRKWDYIRDRYYMVEIPKTGPEPEDWGATSPVPVLPEETYRGFLQQEQRKGERLYQRRIQRMRELGLIEQSNPGNIQEQWASQFQRIGGWWQTLLGWIEDIEKYTGPLIDLYNELEKAGIITKEEKDKAENEGWTKAELISLIKAQMAPTWQTYLPWVIAGGIGVGLLAVLLRRPAPIYVAK